MGSSSKTYTDLVVQGIMDEYGGLRERLFTNDISKIKYNGMKSVIDARQTTMNNIRSLYNKSYMTAMGYTADVAGYTLQSLDAEIVQDYIVANIDPYIESIDELTQGTPSLEDVVDEYTQNTFPLRDITTNHYFDEGIEYVFTGYTPDYNNDLVHVDSYRVPSNAELLNVLRQTYTTPIILTMSDAPNIDTDWVILVAHTVDGTTVNSTAYIPASMPTIVDIPLAYANTLNSLKLLYDGIVHASVNLWVTFPTQLQAGNISFGNPDSWRDASVSYGYSYTRTIVFDEVNGIDIVITNEAFDDGALAGVPVTGGSLYATALGISKTLVMNSIDTVNYVIVRYVTLSGKNKIALIPAQDLPVTAFVAEEVDIMPMIPLKSGGSFVNDEKTDLVLKKIGLSAAAFQGSLSVPAIKYAAVGFGIPAGSTNLGAVMAMYNTLENLDKRTITDSKGVTKTAKSFSISSEGLVTKFSATTDIRIVAGRYNTLIATNGYARSTGSKTRTVTGSEENGMDTTTTVPYTTYIYVKQFEGYYIERELLWLQVEYIHSGTSNIKTNDFTAEVGYDFAGARFPMIRSTLRQVPFNLYQDLIEEAMIIVSYSSITVKTKWYQTGFFGFVVKIVGTVLAILAAPATGGQSLWLIAAIWLVPIAVEMGIIDAKTGMIIMLVVAIMSFNPASISTEVVGAAGAEVTVTTTATLTETTIVASFEGVTYTSTIASVGLSDLISVSLGYANMAVQVLQTVQSYILYDKMEALAESALESEAMDEEAAEIMKELQEHVKTINLFNMDPDAIYNYVAEFIASMEYTGPEQTDAMGEAPDVVEMLLERTKRFQG